MRNLFLIGLLLIGIVLTSFVSAQEPLEILTPSDGAIITEAILIEFTVTNIDNETMEFKYSVPFDDPKGNELSLSIVDMGRRVAIWNTGGAGTGEPVILNPGESITKSVEFNPDRHRLSGNVDIVLSHYAQIDGKFDIGILGTKKISINIPSTSNVLVETNVGEFEYKESKTEETLIRENERLNTKLHEASYNYQDIPIIARIIKCRSVSRAHDYLIKELGADAQSFSLTEFEGSNVYGHNNHFLWLSGSRVIYVGAELLQDFDKEISVDLVKLYLDNYPSDLAEYYEDIEPECGNNICEPGETQQNCFDDCKEAEKEHVCCRPEQP